MVLGYFYKEKANSVEFRLPNNRTGVCLKEYISAEMEELLKNTGEDNKPKVFVKEFNKDLHVELLILGETNGKYECTFFITKTPKPHTLLTGFIEQEEETGYTVQTGLANTKAFLKTQKKYSLGELGVFQVCTASDALVVLRDTVDREIYIGEKSEIYPGLLLKASITGRPRHVVGEPQANFTRLPRLYTATALGGCNPLIETRSDQEEDTDVDALIVYVSESREVVHAVPHSEWLQLVEDSLPNPALVGQEFTATVEEVKDKHTLVVVEQDEERKLRGIILPWHYSDMSTDTSRPLFEENTTIRVKVFAIRGYSLHFTAKKTLFGQAAPTLKNKEVVQVVVRRLTEKGVVCEVIGGALVTLKRFDDEDLYVGKLLKAQIIMKGHTPGMYLGRRFTKDTLETMPGQKAADKVGSQQERTDKQVNSLAAKQAMAKKNLEQFSNGQVVEGKIVKIYQYGAFLRLAEHLDARIKISEISSRFVQDWQSLVHVGQQVKAVLHEIDYDQVRVEASIKKYEVLNMMGALPAEETPETLSPTAAPLTYTEEVPEDSSDEEPSEEDEEFQMEIFNSKDRAEPYIKRILAYPLDKAVAFWSKSLESPISPESKKQLCVSMVTAISRHPENTAAGLEAVLKEGVKRDGVVFLKKCIDNTRNSTNLALYRTLCLWFIKEKKESLFGYRELLFLAQRTACRDTLNHAHELITHSPLKAAEKKEAAILWIETLYRVSKADARTAIEKIITSAETKGKLDWVLKYLALETSSVATNPDIGYVRNLFARFITLPDLATSSAKGIFKLYLSFEKEYGTKDTEKKVLEQAQTYIAQLDTGKVNVDVC